MKKKFRRKLADKSKMFWNRHEDPKDSVGLEKCHRKKQNQTCENELLLSGLCTDDSQSCKIFEVVREVQDSFYFT